MMVLDTDRISARSFCYKVWRERDKYLFETDNRIVYVVSFDPYDGFAGFTAYWFNLANSSLKPSPNDPKVRATVICIIEEFFRLNPNILLYMCDTQNNQQVMRNRLFLRWFNGYEQRMRYSIHTAMVKDENVENYIALILQVSHPYHDEIVSYFESIIDLFNEKKPE